MAFPGLVIPDLYSRLQDYDIEPTKEYRRPVYRINKPEVNVLGMAIHGDDGVTGYVLPFHSCIEQNIIVQFLWRCIATSFSSLVLFYNLVFPLVSMATTPVL